MLFKTFAPDSRLNPFVRFYWFLEPGISDEGHRLLPGSGNDIIVQIGPPATYKYGDSDWRMREPIGFVEGTFNTHFFVRFPAKCFLAGIRFRSTGLFHFVRTPVMEFREKFVDLELVFGSDGHRLIDALGNNRPLAMIPAILDHFLLKVLNVRDVNTGLQKAVDALVCSHGMVTVSDLCRAADLKERRLERAFERHVGVSPQRLSQILRVNRFIRLVRMSSSCSFTRLSFECGFADQSHLIRTFKKHTGLSPREYFKTSHPIDEALSAEHSPRTLLESHF